jgi:hypothetical protein
MTLSENHGSVLNETATLEFPPPDHIEDCLQDV